MITPAIAFVVGFALGVFVEDRYWRRWLRRRR